jgi:hypothetical protein
MPRVLDAHTLLEYVWPYLCDVENDIQKALKCDHRDLLPNMGGYTAMHGRIDRETMAVIRDEVSVVVSPVIVFYTRQQLEEHLGDIPKALIEELKLAKPKAIGNLWAAGSVNPAKMCYELVLAVPFSKED